MHTLRQLWKGELPLSTTYWVYGVLIGGGMALLLNLLTSDPAKILAMEGGVALFWIVLSAMLAYNVVLWVGIWRSAGAYTGKPVWRILAQISVVVGVIKLIGSFGILAQGMTPPAPRGPAAQPAPAAKIPEVVAELNKQFPKMIDPETEIQRVSASSDGVIYHYRLVHVTRQQVDPAKLVPFVRKAGCGNDGIRYLLDAGLSVGYQAADMADTPIAETTLRPGDCPKAVAPTQ